MQGYILTTAGDRSVILGDDDMHYTFTPSEWQSEDTSPEVGTRVDFEVEGSEATDIFPIPGAPQMRPTRSSTPAPSAMGDISSSQPPATPSADERFKERLRQTHRKLETRYDPIRERIGNYGAVAVGVGLLIVSTLIRFDILESILDLIAMVGMLAGVALAGVGVFMLGKDEGWWDKSNWIRGQAGAAPTTTGGIPKSSLEVESNEVAADRDADNQQAGVTASIKRTKKCPHCGEEILFKAIKCRYCGSDIHPEAD